MTVRIALFKYHRKGITILKIEYKLSPIDIDKEGIKILISSGESINPAIPMTSASNLNPANTNPN